MSLKRKTTHLTDYIKSNRKGSREAELAISPGWTAKDRPHKNKKMYDRKREKRDWKNNDSSPAFGFHYKGCLNFIQKKFKEDSETKSQPEFYLILITKQPQ